MLAVRIKDGKPVLEEVPEPVRGEGDALIAVNLAGICATDLEIIRGYMDFEGTLGHEFVGTVLEAPRTGLTGKRVVGSINCGCGECPLCLSGDPRHCPDRTVLGILGRNGAFAPRLTLPARNLVVVPDTVGDETAVFAEPVAAALEILEQVEITTTDEVLVMGDGRLGILCALVLEESGAHVTVSGKSQRKLAVLRELGFDILPVGDPRKFRTVVDATGSPGAVSEAIERTLPLGRVVLKTTTHETPRINLARVVIDEITVVGSRCGPIEKAVAFLAKHGLPKEKLITAVFDLQAAPDAFRAAVLPDSIKVLLKP